MPGVVAPRLLPAAKAASARQQAIESIGTYEWQDFTSPGSRLVSTNGDYWTHLADLAWRRDIDHEYHLHYWERLDGTVEFAGAFIGDFAKTSSAAAHRFRT